MKCKVIKPNITTYAMRFNKDEDPDLYWRCMWARISLDHDNYTLSIVSDCGDYTYSWGRNDHESFLNLMSRINEYYLLDKISSRSKFNLEKSKQETIDRIKNYYEHSDDDDKCNEQIEAVKDVEYYGEEGFYIAVDQIVEDSELIEVVKEYPNGAVTICEIFKTYLQPLLKESNSK
ncbi:hypothetical protein CS063_17220 [Sporanaerobium hydrogeniformans]|uniref:Uncharacterized protein n=1 Tax=Sporanaerobium hydrogeniformans TaxID=3072179 RepID=A0AC61D709_9FIRM|nr:hypothetical protein [Sporanaerobium hydrogeniformans]PHV69192.1 hypothetical protein CS063_17220 [Sporanaerobium hydrogeniformans]